MFLTIGSLLSGQVSEGLVGDFPFTGGSFEDLSGYEDGALSSSAGDGTYYLVPDRFGNADCAIDFQGAVVSAGRNARDIHSEVSVSLWIKTTDIPDGNRFVVTQYGYNFTDVPMAGYSMMYYDSVRFDSRDEDWHHNDYMVSDYSETLVGDGEWHHLVGVTKNSSSSEEATLEIWVDGVKENSITYAWNITELDNPLQSLCIGGSENYNTAPTFKGVIDDIKIYNRGLDSAEVVQLFNASDPLVQPTVEISASETAVCANTPVQFDAVTSDADSIVWDFGDGSVSHEEAPLHAFAEAGNYTIIATAINEGSGLSSSDTIEGGITVYPQYQDTIYLDVPEGDLPYQFGTQSLSAEGTYTETFQTIHSCDSVVTLHFGIIPTGIGEEHGDMELLVRPNPSQGMFQVELNSSFTGPSHFTVYNATGAQVFLKTEPASRQVHIDLRAHEPGIYFLRVQNGNRLLVRKLMLQRGN